MTAQTPGTPDVEETVNEFAKLTTRDWLTAVGIVVVAMVIAFALRATIHRGLQNRSGTLVVKLIGRIVAGMVIAFGLVYALIQVGVSIGPLLGLLGLLGLALALALQDVLSNFIAGTMLSIQRPFRVGDEIRTAEFSGTVEDVSLRSVTMRTFDGVRVFIPNATVWQEPIVNYTTLGPRRTELSVGVGYDVDLDEAQRILTDSVGSHDDVAANPPPEAFVHEFRESSINFVVRFWHEPHMAQEWRVRDVVARGIKRDLTAAGVEIPFPQLVMTLKNSPPAETEPQPDNEA